MKDFLPLGTICTLKRGTKKVMIIGRLQSQTGSDYYDYVACLWPEGMLDTKHFYLFNQEDIDCLYYIGMQDEEEFSFRFTLEEEFERIKQNNY